MDHMTPEEVGLFKGVLELEDIRKTVMQARRGMKEALIEMGHSPEEADARVAEETRMNLPDREKVEQSDVIIGIDRVTAAMTIFYGKSLLTLIRVGYDKKRPAYKVSQVWMDFDTDEPEQLAAWVLYVKGSCDAH